MENIIIKKDDHPVFMPEVLTDEEAQYILVKGESYMEQPFELYSKIGTWLKDYFEQEHTSIKIDFELTYLNSSSYRAILDLLLTIKELQDQNLNIQLNWKYPEMDVNSIQEEGEDLADESEVTLNFVVY